MAPVDHDAHLRKYYYRPFVRLYGAVQEVWPRFLKGIVVNAPVVLFLLYYRLAAEDQYVSYTLPVVGDFPKSVLFDFSILAVAILAWSMAGQQKLSRVMYLSLVVPLAMFVVLFRVVDHYYYSAVKVNLNAYVLYGNHGFVREGVAVVLDAPFFAVFALAVLLHYAAYISSSAYSAQMGRFADRLSLRSKSLTLPLGGTLLLMAINFHSLLINPHITHTLKSFSGEYVFFDGLPRFLREEILKDMALAKRPELFYLPFSANANFINTAHQPRPNIFLITVESFNYTYLAPPQLLHPALTEDIMPFFKSLAKEGFLFTNFYTSSAYTINGFIAVLCSQYTMSESVWGKGCLPELLGNNGYEIYSFVSFGQILPKHYETFRRAGFDRSRVFDAVRMRQGKKNVYFDFMVDKEVLDYAAGMAHTVSRESRKPIFFHIATNQMHIPGFFQHTTCSSYGFPSMLQVQNMTRRMINSAHCTDWDLEQFIAELKRSDLFDEALVIVTADHATNVQFWDYKETELARVPLFVKFPKSESRRWEIETGQVAAQIDIAPTVVDYLGLHNDRPMYGRSLLMNSKTASRNVPGISSSRLLSMASKSGVAFHVHGKPDMEDQGIRDRLDALHDTVLYFDQNPTLFEAVVKNVDTSSRSVRH